LNKIKCQVLLNQVLFGQREVRWLAFYAYIMQVLRLEAAKPIAPLILLAQEVHWWFSTEEVVYATRKLKECIVENNKIVKIVFQDNYTIN
jgi:hypothetical protein